MSMLRNAESSADSVSFAVALLNTAEPQQSEAVQSLLLERSLWRRVHELNELLSTPEHRELAAKALRCMGFEVSTLN